MRGLNRAEAQLGGTLGRLFALAEAYPDLKANQNMLALQEELTSTENKVAFARQAFNDAVTTYNTRREKFPDNLVAGMFGFAPAQLFETESPKERERPRCRSELTAEPPPLDASHAPDSPSDHGHQFLPAPGDRPAHGPAS